MDLIAAIATGSAATERLLVSSRRLSSSREV